MKVAEYIALGLPVVCSGTATMRHYFSEDELMFFEPENAEDLARAIRAVLTNPAAAGERAARSRMKLDKLDWPAQEETLVETVEALAGYRPRQSRRRARVRNPLAGQVRRMRAAEQKDKEITKHA
jgi:glycosyltransferase involved in cell wall biosynthesis